MDNRNDVWRAAKVFTWSFHGNAERKAFFPLWKAGKGLFFFLYGHSDSFEVLCNINLITFEYFCLSKRALFTGQMLPSAGGQVNCRFESVGRNQFHKVFWICFLLVLDFNVWIWSWCLYFSTFTLNLQRNIKVTFSWSEKRLCFLHIHI